MKAEGRDGLVGALAEVARGKFCEDGLHHGLFFWEADRLEILKALKYDSCRYHLVVNLKPGKNISLYEIVWIMGASSKSWTPLLLRLETLFVDYDPSARGSVHGGSGRNLDDFLEEIDLEEGRRQLDDSGSGGGCLGGINGFRTLVHETLYTQWGLEKGHIEGRMKFGKVGRVNGTLLWPLVARRFAHEILTATDYLR